MRPAKTQISLRICAVWSASSLIACDFYSLRAIQRGMNKNPCHTGWMHRLIWVFAGLRGLIVGFVMRWLIDIEIPKKGQILGTQSPRHRLLLETTPKDNIIRKNITKKYLCNFDPLKPHFYIVKLGFTGVYIIFLISAQKHRLWELVRTASARWF